MEKKQRYQRMLVKLCIFAAILLAFILCFLSLFGLFETISIQAMLRMNTEFSAQVSSISDSMQSLIHTIGTQVFYISPTAKLRQSTSMTRNEQVFALRELWQYVIASQMLHSIYIYNGKLGHVYTTDNDHLSAPPESFYDQGAIELFQNRSAGNRMRLIYRTYENEKEYPSRLELVSYLVFEVNADGRVGDSAIMLNLFPSWFSENLLNFSQDRYIILSPDGMIVATQDAALSEQALHVLPRVLERESGYFIDELFGEKTICFHSPIGVNNWYCLRFMSYQDCLPGLSGLRANALTIVGALFIVLFIMLLYALVRIYFPYRVLSSALKNANESRLGKGRQPAFTQLNEMVAASREQKQQDALRRWLNGQPADDGAPPELPAVLFLTEKLAAEELTALLDAERLNAVTISRDRANISLCGVKAPMDAAQLCNRIATALKCRCYYSLPVADMAELPARYAALCELKALRFFSPGQRVFSETLLAARTLSVDSVEGDVNACFAAVKTGKSDAARAALAHLLEHLHNCRYADTLFVLKRLDYLLDAALPDAPAHSERPPLENVLSGAEDTTPIIDYYAPRLDELAKELNEQKQSREREVASQVKHRIECGFRDAALSVQIIAEEMGLSPAYLRKQFHSVYGMSIGDCLNSARIAEVQRLLRETSLPVEQVAQQVGFENTKYMFVLFKKLVGVTPRQYRQEDNG